jgi:polyisoprenoid-binding protein YceI
MRWFVLWALVLAGSPAFAQDPAAIAPVVVAEVPVNLNVVPSRSTIYALAYKAGMASAVAHDHVVQARNPTGTGVWHATDAAQCRVSVSVNVADLFPDAVDLRAKVGLPTPGPSDGQREEILGHILAKYQLYAEQFGTIGFESTSISGTEGDVTVKGNFTLRGVTQPVIVPMHLTRTDEGVHATGKLRILQSQYGYDPYSALFGALAVKDEVDIVLDILLTP